MIALATKDTVKRDGLNIWVDGGNNGAEPKIDVILVQGLNAHPYGTWAGHSVSDESPSASDSPRPWYKRIRKSSQKQHRKEFRNVSPTEIFWPRDLLPQHLEPSRIATYSYPSDWRSRSFKTNIRECGEQLLNVLCRYRENEVERRPLVFVGHSLGGIVIQQALTIADHGDQYINLRESFAGAVFLGSLLQGCDAAGLVAWLEKVVGNDQPLLQTLRPGSPELLLLTRDFWNSYEKLLITCFYKRSDSKCGPFSVRTVTSQSATILGKKRIYLNADHSGLNKFRDEQDDNFQLFLPELKTIVSNAVKHHSHTFVKETGHWLMSFSRDEHFVNRPSIIGHPRDVLRPDSSVRAALVGIVGVGESQIAIEYAFQLREEFPSIHIFQVHASDSEQFRQSYRKIAEELLLPGFDDPKTDVLNLVYQWLRRELNNSWLIILDNMDDARFAHTNHNNIMELQHEFTVRKYLPQRNGGIVLITSRDRDAAFRLVGQAKHFFQVQAMTADEAKSILDHKLEDHLGNNKERKKLATTLEYILLALSQAVAFISRRPRMTIARYLDLLDRDKEGGASLLQNEESDLRRNENVPNSVLRTWQITFDQIRTHHKFAADLLSRMSLFDRKSIPEFPLRATITESDFEEAIDILLGYAIINLEAVETNFEMHKLVQLSTILWLQHLRKLEQHKELALSALAKTYPSGRFENWATCLFLEPHARSLLYYGYSSETTRRSRAQIQRNRAWYYLKQGSYSTAEQLAKQSVYDTTDLLGGEHPDTLISMANLASTYRNQGQWKESEELNVQVVETRKRVLGDEHPSTLTSMANLAYTY